MHDPLILYGCYGYTGKLILEEALQKGLKPVLAGRDKARTEALALAHGLEARVFGLDDPRALREGLKGMKLVMHAAGPFSQTAVPMAEACLSEGLHYLDITGEIAVYEAMAARDAQAREAGIMLLPGTGFDVVPSDCLAAHLHAEMPDAKRLRLAIYSRGGGSSHGTSNTVVENLGRGSLIRRDGKLQKVRAGWTSFELMLEGKKKLAGNIPWGDVTTAWHSTGIPNIETYMVMSKGMARGIWWSHYFGAILRSGWMQRKLKRRIQKQPSGPSEKQLETGNSFVWGEVSNGKQTLHKAIKTVQGYRLTALCTVYVAQKALSGDFKAGFATPSLAYGKGFIFQVPGSEWVEAGLPQ